MIHDWKGQDDPVDPVDHREDWRIWIDEDGGDIHRKRLFLSLSLFEGELNRSWFYNRGEMCF